MPYVDDFLDMMPHTVIVSPGYANEVGTFILSGAVLSLPCYIETQQRTVRAAGGKEQVSTAQIIVGYPSGQLTSDLHRYTIPVEFNPRENLEAVFVDPVSDEDGFAFSIVYLP